MLAYLAAATSKTRGGGGGRGDKLHKRTLLLYFAGVTFLLSNVVLCKNPSSIAISSLCQDIPINPGSIDGTSNIQYIVFHTHKKHITRNTNILNCTIPFSIFINTPDSMHFMTKFNFWPQKSCVFMIKNIFYEYNTYAEIF